ncbi:SapB/AmfS family lanthipeptide [Actinomadura rayongensis]|uniref:SapB/AmfS family lantipeptide n=1 Tax=Actinomadura rayongensis TaxID=1429076 RepID=A0A6I4W5M1_9ACTN|nr:SapB/AmfS family lanthipeptide [Actinomadura rayongensis]MXQ62454.1 SapB/AmfS family lantipeptide [Actinomadura rayongensis]
MNMENNGLLELQTAEVENSSGGGEISYISLLLCFSYASVFLCL